MSDRINEDMRLEETYEEHMNKLATEVAICPKCSSEDVDLCNATYVNHAKDEAEIAEYYCNECDRIFEQCL